MKSYSHQDKKYSGANKQPFFSDLFAQQHSNYIMNGLNTIQKQQNAEQEFEPTERVKSTGEINHFELRNKDMTIQEFGTEEEIIGKIYIPEGSQVVILNKEVELSDHYKVALWYYGRYRIGFIHKSAFGSQSGNEITPLSVSVFIQDANHTIYRSKTKLMQTLAQYDEWYKNAQEKDKPMYLKLKAERESKLQLFHKIILDIETYINQFESGDLIINETILNKVRYKELEFSNLIEQNKVEAVIAASKSIFEVIDPIHEDESKTSQTTLVVPLSVDWFYSNNELRQYYDTIILNSELDRFRGSSGEGIAVSPEAVSQMIRLREYVSTIKSESLTLSPETKWLLSIDSEQLSQYKTFVFLHEKTWGLTSKNQYAEGIALKTSFGPIETHPIKTVLTHEINVNTQNFLPTDTHIGRDKAERSISELQSLSSEDLLNNPELMDAVFQSESYIATVHLLSYFKVIESLQ